MCCVKRCNRVGRRMCRPRALVLCFLLTSLVLARSDHAAAVTLRDALVLTYRTNPTLDAARARLNATKENLPLAQAAGRPNVFGSVDAGFSRDYAARGARQSRVGDFATSATFALTLQQPLFRGFSVVNGVREAKAEIYAGRARLHRLEQDTLLSAVKAYMEALRYQSVARLRRLNLIALGEQFAAARERRRLGEATATDVSQAEARRARSAARLSQTRALLKSAYAEYERVIGQHPEKLGYPRAVQNMVPKSLEDAVRVAIAENPAIASAEHLRAASSHAVNKIRGELLPRADLNLSYSRSDADDRRRDQSDGVAVTARVTVPLYQGGGVYARIRQAVFVAKEREHRLVETQRQVRSDVASVWNQLLSIRSQITSNQRRVEASGAALTGLVEQERRGQRTTTDVLNARQELTESEIELVASQTELVIATFNLVSAMGRLTAVDLELPLGDENPIGEKSQ